MIQTAMRTPSEHFLSLQELDRRLGPLSDAETLRADAYLDALELLEAEQSDEATDQQSELLRIVLLGAELAAGHRSLAELSEASGLPESRLRAAAVALKVAQSVGYLAETKRV